MWESSECLGGRIALLNGKPTVRGRRIAVRTVLELLAAGESREGILRRYSVLEPDDDLCLSFAGEWGRA